VRHRLRHAQNDLRRDLAAKHAGYSAHSTGCLSSIAALATTDNPHDKDNTSTYGRKEMK
jgi:hypothetical protein